MPPALQRSDAAKGLTEIEARLHPAAAGIPVADEGQNPVGMSAARRLVGSDATLEAAGGNPAQSCRALKAVHHAGINTNAETASLKPPPAPSTGTDPLATFPISSSWPTPR